MKSEMMLDTRFALKGATPTYAPDRTFDTEHVRLEIAVDIARERIAGRCRTTLRAITDGAREMTFDAVNFRLKDVRWNGRKLKATYKDGRLKITAPSPVAADQRVTVDIAYEVTRPKLGLYFIKPNRAYPDRPTQVWTQGEDEYARYWFPCHDAPHERTTTEVIATVPDGFTAVSNGRLLKTSRNRRNRTATFHYRQDIPHATYLVTLTVGRFSQINDRWRKVPIQYFCEKGREADTRRAFGKTPKMMDFFSNFTGAPYPYAKYAQIAAADFIYGGMENTSATTQTDTALLDERVSLDYTSDELVAHELAHQWFGDYLTCKDWSHAWLNESFATYFDALFKRQDKGEDEFLYQIRSNADAYFAEDKEHYRRPISTKVFKRPSDLFDRHLYEKGSVVLYMLHRLLGEELFRKSIRTYVRRNRTRVVETIDLIQAIEDATGWNPRRFFDQWIFGAGHPELKIRMWWDPARKEMNLRVNQTHATSNETGLFWLKSEFLFLTPRGEKRFPVEIEKKSHLFKFRLDAEPSMVLFDPDHALLAKVDFPRAEEMLAVQLFKDRNPLGRMDAAHALARTGNRNSLPLLRQVLFNDSFWGVQAEVARALSGMASEEAAAILVHGLDEIPNPKVRRAIYAALRSFKSPRIALEVERRYSTEKSYFAEAEGLRALGALHHPQYPEMLSAALRRDSWNDVIRSAALEGFAASRSREWIPLMFEYTSEGRPQRARMAAIRSLMQYDPVPTAVQERLIELADDPFLLVRIAAVRALHQIGDERALPALRRLAVAEVDGRLKRLAEEAVEKLSKGIEEEKKDAKKK
ncbi:MAG: HEAT repeat domain-containing protein [Elusimicrobia bacterium]|nr:HEAT repeat domain-containing protein [Elusimicrobiota bacterium]